MKTGRRIVQSGWRACKYYLNMMLRKNKQYSMSSKLAWLNWIYICRIFTLRNVQKAVTLIRRMECCVSAVICRSCFLRSLMSLTIKLNSLTWVGPNCSVKIRDQVVRVFEHWTLDFCCLLLIVCFPYFAEFSFHFSKFFICSFILHIKLSANKSWFMNGHILKTNSVAGFPRSQSLGLFVYWPTLLHQFSFPVDAFGDYVKFSSRCDITHKRRGADWGGKTGQAVQQSWHADVTGKDSRLVLKSSTTDTWIPHSGR